MDNSYRDLFFGESQEYLKEINKALVILEQDTHDLESINSIFRLMHTLKGMAATMGYKDIAEFAHRLEDVFDTFRLGKSELTSDKTDVIFESIDAFNTLIEDSRDGKTSSVDITIYLQKLGAMLPQSEQSAAVQKIHKYKEIKIDHAELRKFVSDGSKVFRVEVLLSEECPMKGVRTFLIINRAKNFGEVIRTFPEEEVLKDEDFGNSFDVLLASKEESAFIQKEMAKILEVEKITVHLIDVQDIRKLERKEKKNANYIKKIQSMRIPVERLDKIMNVMGELAIIKSRLVQTVQSKDYPSLEDAVYMVERLVSSLQDEALKMRLLPISFILDNFPRIVRDLARKEGKKVALNIYGSEIELDRVVIDEIGDPLVHLIRNSIDHGIEKPEIRESTGKNPQGQIDIRVTRERGHINVEMCDDGGGVDCQKVLKRAIDKGLLTQEEAARVESSQILDVLIMPGFSTKEEVSDISGRGVGLDAVKNKIDGLGGRLELQTEKGKGSKFTLTLPLTLAIIKAMLVKVGDQIFAVPLMSIRETVKIKDHEIKLIKDIEVVRLREDIIPVLRLDREFRINSYEGESPELSLVIVEGRSKSIALMVDQIIGEQDIVVKPLGALVKKSKGVAGATILGDGRVALILDIVNIR